MRRFIFASHHKMAYGLKNTADFLTNGTKEIYDINAYLEDNEPELSEVVKDLFDTFDVHDEVIVLTDLMGGSVYQKFYPYISEHVHIICGMNLPLAMSFLLAPEDELLSTHQITDIVKECKNQIVYVNQLNPAIDYGDE